MLLPFAQPNTHYSYFNEQNSVIDNFMHFKICQSGKLRIDNICQLYNTNGMRLVELRKQNKLTQKQAASLIGVPYRTYVRYEENESYSNSYKYKKIMEDLINIVKVDEEHGLLTVDKIKELLIPLLFKHNIAYCYLFGSYARGTAREDSDIDILVDTDITGIAFFNLVEEIRITLNKRIDLLRLVDLKSDNPLVLDILKTGIRII